MYQQFIVQSIARDLWKQHYPEVSEDVMKRAMTADPTVPVQGDPLSHPFGTFTKQILLWHKKSPEETGALYTPSSLSNQLEKYMEMQRYLPPEFSNINKFKTHTEFYDFMRFKAKPYATKVKEKKAAEESSVFFEDDEWIVRIPKTYFASEFYGHTPAENGGYESSWCTTYSSNHFNHYLDGVIFMILNKDTPGASVQMFIQEEGGQHALMDYKDNKTDAGAIPEDIRDAIEAKFDIDLKEEFGFNGEHAGDEAEDNSYTRVDFRLWADRNGTVVSGSYSAERNIYNDDDMEENGYLSAPFVITPFDLDEWSPEELAALPDINFAAKGYVVLLENGGAHDLEQSVHREWPNEEWDQDGVDPAEIRDSILDLMRMKPGDTSPTGNVSSWQYQQQISEGKVPGLQASFIIFLYTNEYSLGTNDDLVGYIKDAMEEFTAPGRAFTESEEPVLHYDGSTYESVILYDDGYGGIEEALLTPDFKGHMSGIPGMVAPEDNPATYRAQAEADRQLKFDGIDSHRKYLKQAAEAMMVRKGKR